MKILPLACLAIAGLGATCAALFSLAEPSAPMSVAEVASTSVTASSGVLAAKARVQRAPVGEGASGERAARVAAASAAAPAADYAIAARRSHPADDAVYEATNAAQGLRVAFAAAGVRFVPQQAFASLAMDLRAIGRGDRMQSVTDGVLHVRGERIDYQRTSAAGATFTEYFVNRSQGVEQSFHLEAPLERRRNGEPLRIELACSGELTARMVHAGDAIAFATEDGAHAMRYDGLYAFDARGRELPSHMELRGQRLALVVDDAAAVYPVTVDPKMGRGSGNTASDVEMRDDANDGIVSGENDGEDPPADYIDGVNKVSANYGFTLDMSTKGTNDPHTARFDFGFARRLPPGDGEYVGTPDDVPPGTDGNRVFVNSVQLNTWGGLAYERTPTGWQRTADVAAAEMAIDEVAYMGFNVNLHVDNKNVIDWRLFFGLGRVGPFPALDAEPVKVTRTSETTWTIEALDLGRGVRASLLKRVETGNLVRVADYDLPFQMTFTKQ